MKASDIRRGHVLILDGQPCRVMDFQHRTPGNLRRVIMGEPVGTPVTAE